MNAARILRRIQGRWPVLAPAVNVIRKGGRPLLRVLWQISSAHHSVVGRLTKVSAEVMRVTALGSSNLNAKGREVWIFEARTRDGKVIDLSQHADPAKIRRDVVLGSQRAATAIQLFEGEWVDLPVGEGGAIFLLAHACSGTARISTAVRSLTFDLFANSSSIVQFDATLIPAVAAGVSHFVPDREASGFNSIELWQKMAVIIRHREILADTPVRDTLALYTPRWKGVTAATINLFPCALPIPFTPDMHPDQLTDLMIGEIADAIVASPFGTIVISGGDPAFVRIFEECRRRKPALRIMLLWHSSYMQMGEQHDWRLMMPWLAAAEAGHLARFGVVKPGLDKFLRARGIDSAFIQNVVPFNREPGRAIVHDAVGLWHSGSTDYRKPLLPSLLAVADIAGMHLRCAGVGELGRNVIDELRIPVASFSAKPIAHGSVMSEMRLTDLTLYVTLSECMPMVPLESIAQGTPCLIGPSTGLFTEDPLLFEKLIVKDPSNPVAIRRAILDARDDLDRLRLRSGDYLELLNARGRETLLAFLQ